MDQHLRGAVHDAADATAVRGPVTDRLPKLLAPAVNAFAVDTDALVSAPLSCNAAPLVSAPPVESELLVTGPAVDNRTTVTRPVACSQLAVMAPAVNAPLVTDSASKSAETLATEREALVPTVSALVTDIVAGCRSVAVSAGTEIVADVRAVAESSPVLVSAFAVSEPDTNPVSLSM